MPDRAYKRAERGIKGNSQLIFLICVPTVVWAQDWVLEGNQSLTLPIVTLYLPTSSSCKCWSYTYSNLVNKYLFIYKMNFYEKQQ
jgi:hypothetical protein